MNNLFSRQYHIVIWILLFGFFLGADNVFAQSGTVSVDFKNASPKEIIDNLESRTPYRFIYQDDIDLNAPRVSMKKDNVSIDEVLEEFQKLTGLNFRRNNNNIAINKKEPAKKKKGGGISGKVVDNYGKPIFDAILITQPGGESVFTDTKGDFIIELLPGNYNIEITAEGFASQLIENIPVQAGEHSPLNIGLKLADQNISLDEVVITGQQYKSSASTEGLLLQQKKAAQFSDGISAEQIARTPDNDVGNSLKRITGITTVDDKFVVVRSMGERWNQAVMDGVNLPSTDPFQQTFSFDIIPTTMVESIVVSKTATPDMYANFAGGYVEVRTKSIPKEDFTTFTVSTSYNTRSTFQQQLSKQRGKYDYFGFDDGTRKFPELQAIPVPTNEAESGPFIEQSKKFTEDNFTTYKTKADPNSTLQFSIGRGYELKNSDKWGFVGSVMLRNTQNILEIDHTERGFMKSNTAFTIPRNKDGYYQLNQFGYKNKGASYSYNTTLSSMFNAGLQLGNSRFAFRNAYIHIYDNQLTHIDGWKPDINASEIVNGSVFPDAIETAYPVYQNFMQSKLEGNHRMGNTEINWFVAFNSIDKEIKDATFSRQNRKKIGDDKLLYIDVYNVQGDAHSRQNLTNDEQDYNVGINVNHTFTTGIVKNDIKAGYFGTFKRATNQQVYSYLQVLGKGREEVYMPYSELLDGTHYNYGGFGWYKVDFYGNKYIGEVKVHSPFLMLDNKIGNFIRLVWGLRAESFVYNQISSQSKDPAGLKQIGDDKKWQVLPSVNITVSPTEKTNIRLGYFKSVLRPQFAERLQIPYYDPIREGFILNRNDKGIISSVSENYDLKFEYFPSLGQLLSFGVYAKNIKDPIEGVSFTDAETSRNIYMMNSYSAKLWGIEAEIIKNLSFLGEGKALENIYISANGTINDTKVTSYKKKEGDGGLYEANRPLYGQSPYSYNLGFEYRGDRAGFSIRQNGTGDQYVVVGFDYDSEEIRMPYSVTDVQVSYKFFKEKNLELKFSAQNLFDRPIETYNNTNTYTVLKPLVPNSNPREMFDPIPGAGDKYDEGVDRKLFKAWTGTTLKLSLTYSF